MVDNKRMLLQQLPAVDTVLNDAEVVLLHASYGVTTIKRALRALLDTWRQQILTDAWQEGDLEAAIHNLPQLLAKQIAIDEQPSLRSVINATGIINHTNLGRAVLAEAAVQQITQVARSYSTLEMAVPTGTRGSRYTHVVDLLCELTGAEDAFVVNNNAGAVLLVLAALTSGHDVIVSRGQLVEIGGSFRIPEVMEQSGSHLVEVGSTNKTHLFDYEQAITANTAALLKVHTSNYRVIGFTEEVASQELTALAQRHELLAIEDLGSGVFVDLRNFGHQHEPTVQASIAAGMDVVTFSGDKLLGGPQAGIIVGRKACIDRLRLHPLTRALRIDKLTLAGLEATLRLYRDTEVAAQEIPTLRMMAISVAELRMRAQRLMAELSPDLRAVAAIEDVASVAQVGGGSLPGYDLPSIAIAVKPHTMSADELERSLRLGATNVFTRIHQDRVLLDMRTIQPQEESLVIAALAQALLGRTEN